MDNQKNKGDTNKNINANVTICNLLRIIDDSLGFSSLKIASTVMYIANIVKGKRMRSIMVTGMPVISLKISLPTMMTITSMMLKNLCNFGTYLQILSISS